MRKLVVIFVLFAAAAWAQEAAPDTTKPAPPWTHTLVGSLLGNQTTFTDWKQGGEDAIAWNTLLEGKSVYDEIGRASCRERVCYVV